MTIDLDEEMSQIVDYIVGKICDDLKNINELIKSKSWEVNKYGQLCLSINDVSISLNGLLFIDGQSVSLTKKQQKKIDSILKRIKPYVDEAVDIEREKIKDRLKVVMKQIIGE